MFDLTGKRALVTGATGGLGGDIARTLHAQGAIVTLSGTRAEKLEELAAELGERAFIAPCNLSDGDAVDALPKQAAELMDGGVDILVSNAGLTRDGLLMRMKADDWNLVQKVNLEAYFRLTKACLRSMMKARYGRIIGITSVVGVTGNPGPSQLCGLESRHDRFHQILGIRSRRARHNGKLYRAGFYRVSNDRCPQRETNRSHSNKNPRR